MEFTARNYNQMAPAVYTALSAYGEPSTSRNGNVLRLKGVVNMTVEAPWERVNFSPVRDANPFFHLIEAMAMLGNVNDATFLAHFAKNMLTFSDDGQHYNAFYGERMRSHFGSRDQLLQVIRELDAKPDSRQAVVQIWDPADLWKETKDKACNLCLMFSVTSDGLLAMTSINRSNDAIWGILTGANVVHLSFFQEYVALALGRHIGPWTHVSNNLHVYTESPQWPLVCDDHNTHDLYDEGRSLNVVPMFELPELRSIFDTGLVAMLGAMRDAIDNKTLLKVEPKLHRLFHGHLPFLGDTVIPAFNAWQLRKLNPRNRSIMREYLGSIKSDDWRLACAGWMERRWAKEDTK